MDVETCSEKAHTSHIWPEDTILAISTFAFLFELLSQKADLADSSIAEMRSRFGFGSSGAVSLRFQLGVVGLCIQRFPAPSAHHEVCTCTVSCYSYCTSSNKVLLSNKPPSPFLIKRTLLCFLPHPLPSLRSKRFQRAKSYFPVSGRARKRSSAKKEKYYFSFLRSSYFSLETLAIVCRLSPPYRAVSHKPTDKAKVEYCSVGPQGPKEFYPIVQDTVII